MKRKLFFKIIICVTILLICIFGYFFFLKIEKTSIINYTKQLFPREKFSGSYVIPEIKKLKVFDNLNKYPVNNHLGLEFRAPWTGNESESSKTSNTGKLIIFTDEKKMIITLDPHETPELLFEEHFGEKIKEYIDKFKEVLGDKFKDHYYVSDYILSSSPDLLNTKMTKQELEVQAMAIQFKAQTIFCRGKIYKFETSDIKGFLVKDSAQSTFVWLFKDNRYYEIVFPSQYSFSQDDIDLILSTTKLVDK